jgi:hypothetical protein
MLTRLSNDEAEQICVAPQGCEPADGRKPIEAKGTPASEAEISRQFET